MTRRVTLLTTTSCALCEQAKGVLADLARDFPLNVEEIDVGSDEGRVIAEQAGMAFPPCVLLDGKPFSYGRLSERKLRRELLRT